MGGQTPESRTICSPASGTRSDGSAQIGHTKHEYEGSSSAPSEAKRGGRSAANELRQEAVSGRPRNVAGSTAKYRWRCSRSTLEISPRCSVHKKAFSLVEQRESFMKHIREGFRLHPDETGLV